MTNPTISPTHSLQAVVVVPLSVVTGLLKCMQNKSLKLKSFKISRLPSFSNKNIYRVCVILDLKTNHRLKFHLMFLNIIQDTNM